MIAWMLKIVRRWRVDSAVYDAILRDSLMIGISRHPISSFSTAKRSVTSLTPLEYGQSIKRLKSKGWIYKTRYGWFPRFR